MRARPVPRHLARAGGPNGSLQLLTTMGGVAPPSPAFLRGNQIGYSRDAPCLLETRRQVDLARAGRWLVNHGLLDAGSRFAAVLVCVRPRENAHAQTALSHHGPRKAERPDGPRDPGFVSSDDVVGAPTRSPGLRGAKTSVVTSQERLPDRVRRVLRVAGYATSGPMPSTRRQASAVSRASSTPESRR